MQARRAVLMMLVATAILGTPLSPGLGLPSPAPSSGIAWSASDVAVSDTDPVSQTSHAEISIAIDPSDPSRMVIAAMDYSRESSLVPTLRIPSVRLWSSADGGATWTDRGLAPAVGPGGAPLTCSEPYAADPVALFDADGVAYVAYLSYGCPQGRVVAFLVSEDGGASWSDARIALVAGDRRLGQYCDSMDKEWLDLDPSTGDVVLVWTAFLSDCAGNSVGYPIFFTRSSDRAQTWSEPALASGSVADKSVGAFPQVAPDGTIFVAYPLEIPEIGCPIVQITTDQHVATQQMMVARSTDGGATWSQHVVSPICPMQYAAPDHPFSSGGAWLSQAALALDPDTGALFVAWADRSVPSPSAIVMRSTDGAMSWEHVHVAAAPGYAWLLPTMVARGDRVVLLSLREHSTGLYDAAVDVSGDGGATWSSTALNSAPLCSCFLQLRTTQRSGGMFGHYIGLDAQGATIAAAWMDNRDAIQPQGVYARVGHLG